MADSTEFDVFEGIDVDFDALLIDAKAPKYPAKEHAKSVAKHLGVESGLVYLVGRPSVLYEDSDMGPVFHQRRYFMYMSGANFEDAVVTYDIKRDMLRLFIPPINPKTVIWLGATPTPAECRAKYDIDSVLFTNQLNAYVLKWTHANKGSKIFALHENQAPKHLLSWIGLSESQSDSLIDISLLQPAMDAARVIKSSYEIGQIRKANEISDLAHRNILKAIKSLKNESELDAIFQGTCIALHAKQQAYGVIAASGANASTLHYMANNEPLEGRELICVDAGAEWDCYASDVTRTFPISGKFTPEAKAIYDIVDAMQSQCIDRIKPGVAFYDLVKLSQDIALKGLMELGVLHNGSFEEIRSAGTLSAFFPHGLGHHVGLEVHDVAGGDTLYMTRRSHRGPPLSSFSMPHNSVQSTLSQSVIGHRRKLEPGMVVTIEPGIYFSKFAFENLYLKHEVHSKYINAPLLDKYYPVGGVRIEDDILVTKDGYENLTTAPKGDDALKIINGDDESSMPDGGVPLWKWFW